MSIDVDLYDDQLTEDDRALVALVVGRLRSFVGPMSSVRVSQFRESCFSEYCDGCGAYVGAGGRCYCRSDW